MKFFLLLVVTLVACSVVVGQERYDINWNTANDFKSPFVVNATWQNTNYIVWNFSDTVNVHSVVSTTTDQGAYSESQLVPGYDDQNPQQYPFRSGPLMALPNGTAEVFFTIFSGNSTATPPGIYYFRDQYDSNLFGYINLTSSVPLSSESAATPTSAASASAVAAASQTSAATNTPASFIAPTPAASGNPTTIPGSASAPPANSQVAPSVPLTVNLTTTAPFTPSASPLPGSATALSTPIYSSLAPTAVSRNPSASPLASGISTSQAAASPSASSIIASVAASVAASNSRAALTPSSSAAVAASVSPSRSASTPTSTPAASASRSPNPSGGGGGNNGGTGNSGSLSPSASPCTKDTDGDGVPDCFDLCPRNKRKTAPSGPYGCRNAPRSSHTLIEFDFDILSPMNCTDLY